MASMLYMLLIPYKRCVIQGPPRNFSSLLFIQQKCVLHPKFHAQSQGRPFVMKVTL